MKAIQGATLLVFFLLIGFAPIEGAAQSKTNPQKHLKKARKLKQKYRFESAEGAYKDGLIENPNNFDLNFELGLLYVEGYSDEEKALPYFKRAENNMPNDTVYEFYYYYGQVQMLTGDYQKARRSFIRLEEGIDDRESDIAKEVDQLIASCDYAIAHANEKKGKLTPIDKRINTKFEEYMPVVSESDSLLYYTRRAPTGGKAKLYNDLKHYEAVQAVSLKDSKITEVKKVSFSGITSEKKRNKVHESVISVSETGDSLILYQGNKLWYAFKKQGVWGKPELFPKTINFGEYQKHAAWTRDGKTLYFSSKHKDGQGGLDLYKATMNADGTWGEAQSLGDAINTSGDEDSPILSPDEKTLYFSSNGHPGFGGYDVFSLEQTANGWGEPKNLGQPINSAANDIYFKYVGPSKAYMASSRLEGKGGMDIYAYSATGVADFDECEPYANLEYKISLDASGSLDRSGEPLYYEWDMGDGNKVKGKKLDYTYRYPGNYQVVLNAIDSLTGAVFYQDTELEVNIDSVTHIEITGPDSVIVAEEATWTAEHSVVFEGSIDNVFWKLNDDEAVEDSVFTNTFDTVGRHVLKLAILSTNAAGEEEQYCAEQQIVVVPAGTKISDTDEPLIAGNQDGGSGSGSGSGTGSGDSGQGDSGSGSGSGDSGSGNTGTGSGSGNDDPFLNDKPIDTDKVDPDVSAFADMDLKPIYYDFDRYNIRPDAKKILDANIAALKANPKAVIQVSAHTDSKGGAAYNVELSRKRANAAVDYLIAHGIDPDRIEKVVYLGESKPIAPNTYPDGADYPAGRKLNRRTELEVIGGRK